MNRRQFPIDRDGPMRVELTWKPRFDDTRVFVDGALVHTFFDWNQFAKGAAMTLADGSVLFVRGRGLLGIEVRRNGIALPGSDMDPAFSLGVSARWMFVVGGISLAVEIERLFRVDASVLRTIIALEALGDAVFLGLALLVRQGQRWALGVAAAMMLISTAIGWTMGRSIVASCWMTLMFALLVARFLATGPSAPVAVSSASIEKPARPKRNPLGWPSREDDV